MSGKRLTNFIMILGVLLILSAVCVLLITEVSEMLNASSARKTASELRELMPEVHASFPDDRINMQLPVAEYDGESYAGIIEVPKFDCELPICSSWKKSKLSRCPAIFAGSIYSRDLVIGGSNRSGQLDFPEKISIGDSVYITDMTGARFSYEVSDIRRTKDVSSENLTEGNHDLTLFAKNKKSLDYTVVRLKLK